MKGSNSGAKIMLKTSLQVLKLFTLIVSILFVLSACATVTNPKVSTPTTTITGNNPTVPNENSILRFGYEVDATSGTLQLVSVDDKAISELDTQAALNATHLAFRFRNVAFPVGIANRGDVGTATVDFEFDNKANNVWANLKVRQIPNPNSATPDATKVVLKVPNGDSDISIGKEFVNTCFLPSKDATGDDDATFDGTDSFILSFEANFTTSPFALYIDVVAEAADAVIGFDSLCGGEQNNSSQTLSPPLAAPDAHTFPGTEVDAFAMQLTPAHADDSDTPPNPFTFTTNPLNIFHDSSQTFEPFFLARDVDNPQNPNRGQDPEGEVSWDFNIPAGVTNLKLFVDLAAKGDFEASDTFQLTYQIDGGLETDAITFLVNEAGSQTYQLFNDDPLLPTTDTLFDPLTITDDTGTTTASNIFKTYTAALTGTGTNIKIRFKVVLDGGTEMVALKNLFVTDTTP